LLEGGYALELSKELFEELTRADGVRSDANGDERRRHTRVPVTIRATLVPMAENGPGAPIQIKVREMSVSGMSFMSSGDVPVTGLFAAAIPTRKGSMVRLLCEAVRWQRGTGALVTGAKFVRLLEGSQSVTLLPPPVEIKPVKPPVAPCSTTTVGSVGAKKAAAELTANQLEALRIRQVMLS
jgi:hypothetical protein